MTACYRPSRAHAPAEAVLCGLGLPAAEVARGAAVCGVLKLCCCNPAKGLWLAAPLCIEPCLCAQHAIRDAEHKLAVVWGQPYRFNGFNLQMLACMQQYCDSKSCWLTIFAGQLWADPALCMALVEAEDPMQCLSIPAGWQWQPGCKIVYACMLLGLGLLCGRSHGW